MKKHKMPAYLEIQKRKVISMKIIIKLISQNRNKPNKNKLVK